MKWSVILILILLLALCSCAPSGSSSRQNNAASDNGSGRNKAVPAGSYTQISQDQAKDMMDRGYVNVYEFGGIVDWTGKIVKEELH